MGFEDYIIEYYCRKNKEHQIKSKKEAQEMIEYLKTRYEMYPFSCERHITLSENYMGFYLNIVDKNQENIFLKDRFFLTQESYQEFINYFYRNICGFSSKNKIQVSKLSHQEIEVYGFLFWKESQNEIGNINRTYFEFTSFDFEKFQLLLKSLQEFSQSINQSIYERIGKILETKNQKKLKNARIRVQYQ